MSGLDASYYLLEDANTPLHVAMVIVFEGPAPAHADLVGAIAAKLPRVPRYRQRVRPVPLHLGRPVWTDDARFEIGYHVRHTAIPAPGTDEQLRGLAGRVLGQRLDPAKPLWEMWLVEGLSGGRWALIAKVHHCMVDGVAGMDLATMLFDLSPDPAPAPAEERGPGEREDGAWAPDPEPSSLDLLLDSARQSVTVPVRHLGDAVRGAGAMAQPGRFRDFALGAGRAAARFARPSSGALNGPIGPHRRWSWQQVPLDDAKTVRKALGGTVNDVVLAAVTSGYRELLNARDSLDPGTVVRSAVPVSLRADGDRGVLDNRVGSVFVNLPVGVADPLERLRLIRAETDDVKSCDQAAGAGAVTRLADLSLVPALLALGTGLPVRLRQDMVQTITTNVPGPNFPLYVLGRRVLEMHPYVPLVAGIRVATAIVSYCGSLHFGITGDLDAMPDLDLLAKGVQGGFDELLRAAEG